MELYKHQNADIELFLKKTDDLKLIADICCALGDETRLKILRELQTPPFLKSIAQIKKAVNVPKTTLIRHLQKLEEANIISVLYRSSTHGTARVYQRDMRNVNISLYFTKSPEKKNYLTDIQQMRVGRFVDFHGQSFGFATTAQLHNFVTEDCFSADRYDAELVFATKGTIDYYFSNKAAKYNDIKQLDLSFEICSEAPYHDNDYMSDVTVWINDCELVTFTCEGDYGDRRGKLNPDWWPEWDTQYGKLMNVTVTEDGVLLNGNKIFSRVKLKDLRLENDNKIKVKIGNKDTAAHPGGFNLFGKRFGDHAQDINLTLSYASENHSDNGNDKE